MKRRDFVCGLSGVVLGFAMSELFRFKTDYDMKHQVPPFGVALTTHCNLNCKCCDTFAPVSRKWFMPKEQFISDMEKLKSLYNAQTWNGCFTGGEPLLHPDLESIIEETFRIFPHCKTGILTNGILLNEKDDSFWKLLNKYNITLVVTEYPINIDRKKYEEKAKKYNVSIKHNEITTKKLYDLASKKVIDANYQTKGSSSWGKPVLDLSGSQNYKEKVYSCPSRGCHIYTKGNIYACYLHSNIDEFANYFKIAVELRKGDFLPVQSVKSKEEISDFFERPNALCRYCKYCHSVCYGKEAIDWDFSKKEFSEWT